MCSKRQSPSTLEPIDANAAGIDIGSQTHWVCVPADRAAENVRSFGCFTADLYALAGASHFLFKRQQGVHSGKHNDELALEGRFPVSTEHLKF